MAKEYLNCLNALAYAKKLAAEMHPDVGDAIENATIEVLKDVDRYYDRPEEKEKRKYA